ncbi:MAG: hypothetical protein H6739_06530 [Alphaproteobacteria bacterium]|nr:hypothetical protein [Alphaproteobacteria bacterium]
MDERFAFEGLRCAFDAIHRFADDTGYLVLYDRTPPRREEVLGRLDVERPGRRLRAEEICAWVRDTAQRNALGEERCRFRLRLYAPKGYRALKSVSFSVADTAPVLSTQQEASDAICEGIRELGERYAQYGQQVFDATLALQAEHRREMEAARRQLAARRAQVGELVACVVAMAREEQRC